MDLYLFDLTSLKAAKFGEIDCRCGKTCRLNRSKHISNIMN